MALLSCGGTSTVETTPRPVTSGVGGLGPRSCPLSGFSRVGNRWQAPTDLGADHPRLHHHLGTHAANLADGCGAQPPVWAMNGKIFSRRSLDFPATGKGEDVARARQHRAAS